MSDVKWGIISTARINRLFLEGARQASGVEIAAVASRDRATAEEYARENEIATAHGSYEALLDDPQVEAVYIPLPNSMHVEWSIRALQSGKHVLCEKPMSRRTQEVERAFDAAEQHGRLLMEAFMWRHNPQTARLTDLLEQGAVGRIRMIRAAFGFVTNDPANVRLQTALDGGGLMDVGSYCVSATRLLAGEPERVSAEQSLGGDGVDVAFAATMRHPNDIISHFDCGLALDSRDLLEIVGDAGSLRLDDPWHCRNPGIQLTRGNDTEHIEIERANSYGLEAENFSAAIRGNATPLLGRDDATGQARTIEALYRAADTGQAVTLASLS
ncbi:MAG TPA: Gfo/Idh/MocA family oxidoreductase [Solirubrobacteraceae bacterium]|nr:Gfo/Idh/MocA family oxidoreductase [Solirubrobacteraceae bacterium]